MATNFIGFDSAWSDNPKKPGAICALRIEGEQKSFDPPRLVGFDDAKHFIRERHKDGDLTLVAIDQPTIVKNQTGMRPVERAVASIISWSGGGIQPAYRDKAAMFGDDAPIWCFLTALSLKDDPEAARHAAHGLFVMEVYPALALLSLDSAFTTAAKCGPRYNPVRKTFRQKDWEAVLNAASREALRLNLPTIDAWCAGLDQKSKPNKACQDRLDSILCLLIAVLWRSDRDRCVMIGDRENGYIVAPVSDAVRTRLAQAAFKVGVAII